MTYHVAERGNFCNSDHVKLITVTDHFQVFVAQAWWHIDQYVIVTAAQKIQCLRHCARQYAARLIVAFGSRDQLQATRMTQQETLQQLGIQSIIILDQLKKMIAVVCDPKVKSCVPKIRVQIDKESFL